MTDEVAGVEIPVLQIQLSPEFVGDASLNYDSFVHCYVIDFVK